MSHTLGHINVLIEIFVPVRDILAAKNAARKTEISRQTLSDLQDQMQRVTAAARTLADELDKLAADVDYINNPPTFDASAHGHLITDLS